MSERRPRTALTPHGIANALHPLCKKCGPNFVEYSEQDDLRGIRVDPAKIMLEKNMKVLDAIRVLSTGNKKPFNIKKTIWESAVKVLRKLMEFKWPEVQQLEWEVAIAARLRNICAAVNKMLLKKTLPKWAMQLPWMVEEQVACLSCRCCLYCF